MNLPEFTQQHETHYSAQHYPLTLDDYQERAATTAIFPPERALEYTVLGLCSEAGEVASKLKKFIRNDYGPEGAYEMISDELSDVLWYVAAVASALGMSLEEVAILALDKLRDRKARGVLQGSGDAR